MTQHMGRRRRADRGFVLVQHRQRGRPEYVLSYRASGADYRWRPRHRQPPPLLTPLADSPTLPPPPPPHILSRSVLNAMSFRRRPDKCSIKDETQNVLTLNKTYLPIKEINNYNPDHK